MSSSHTYAVDRASFPDERGRPAYFWGGRCAAGCWRKALEGKKTYNTWQQGFLNIFYAVLENKPFIMNVYRSVSREQVEIYLYRVTYDLLIGVVNERSANMSVSEDDKKFIADFYKFAFVGIMLEWIKNDMKADPKQIVDRISNLIHGDITRALENCRTDRPVTSNHSE